MAAYYSENDPFAAAWLRELIREGQIADGEVDERSIADVRARDLDGFIQCHFFSGIGGWSLALRLAGWPDDRPVWTGSCPCQPFSSAGAQAGGDDPRHLWPAWFRLLRECRPATVFGEQVAAAVGHGWLDLVCDDLEREDYAVGAVCLPGPVSGAFDIRQRLWFVAERLADAEHAEWRALRLDGGCDGPHDGREEAHGEPGTCGEVRELADAARGGFRIDGRASGERGHVDERDPSGELGDPDLPRSQGREQRGHGTDERAARTASLGNPWADAVWLSCRDGKARPVEPGTFPLATGVPARVGRLRGYGNAIKPQVAAEVIRAYLER